MWKLSSRSPPTPASEGNYLLNKQIHTSTEFTSQLIGTMQPLTNYTSEHCRQSEVSPCPCCWRNKPDKDVWVTIPHCLSKHGASKCENVCSVLFPHRCPFWGCVSPSEMRVKGQPSSPDYWDHMRVTESGIYGVGHVSFTLQLSQIPSEGQAFPDWQV